MLHLSEKEVCELLSINARTLKKRIENGTYPPASIENGRLVFTTVWLDAAKAREEALTRLQKEVQKKLYN